jgi:hypothetical protein
MGVEDYASASGPPIAPNRAAPAAAERIDVHHAGVSGLAP